MLLGIAGLVAYSVSKFSSGREVIVVTGVSLVAFIIALIGLKQSPMFAPLMGIMKRYFDSMALAPDIDTPLLALVGTADTAVLPERSLKLVEGWGGEAQVKQYEGEDHNLLSHENNSWRDIAQFLERVARD